MQLFLTGHLEFLQEVPRGESTSAVIQPLILTVMNPLQYETARQLFKQLPEEVCLYLAPAGKLYLGTQRQAALDEVRQQSHKLHLLERRDVDLETINAAAQP